MNLQRVLRGHRPTGSSDLSWWLLAISILRRSHRITAENASIFQRIESELAGINQRSQAASPVERLDFLTGTYKHLIGVLDVTSTLVAKEIQADAAIALKFLWIDDDDPPVIQTFLRNTDSDYARCYYQPPNYYPYDANTAFKEIIESRGKQRYFRSDNLLALQADGKYQSANQSWPSYYNTTAVASIPYQRHRNSGLVGFLCADSRFGPMSSESVRGILAAISDHLYDVFRVILANIDVWDPVEEPNIDRVIGSILTTPLNIGWSYREEKFQVRNAVTQRQFQKTLSVMKDAFCLTYSPPEHEDQVYSSASGEKIDRRAPIGDRRMDEDIDYSIRVVSDEQSNEVYAQPHKPVSDEEFVRILEKIAAFDPYAKRLLEGAQKKGIGQPSGT